MRWKKYGEDKFFIGYRSGRDDAPARHHAAVVLKERGFKVDAYPGGLQECTKAGFPIGGTEAKNPDSLWEVPVPPALQPCASAESIGTLRLS